MNLYGDPISIKVDTNSKDAAPDVTDNTTPNAWLGADWHFRFGFKYGETWLDVANLTSVTMRIMTAWDGTILIDQTTAVIDSTCNEVDFDAGTKQHVSFSVPRANTGLSLASAQEKSFHLVLYATTASGEQMPLGVSSLKVVASGMEVSGSAPAGDPTYYTAAQVNALLVNLGVTSGGKFYKFVVDTPGGDVSAPVLGLAGGV